MSLCPFLRLLHIEKQTTHHFLQPAAAEDLHSGLTRSVERPGNHMAHSAILSILLRARAHLSPSHLQTICQLPRRPFTDQTLLKSFDGLRKHSRINSDQEFVIRTALHLHDVLLHPVVVAIHTVSPYVGLLGYEFTVLQA